MTKLSKLLVAKTLNICEEQIRDWSILDYETPLIYEQYGRVANRISRLHKNNEWSFNISNQLEIDTYICVGLSIDKKVVEHVWIIPNKGDFKTMKAMVIRNGQLSLFCRKYLEVDAKSYNEQWIKILNKYEKYKVK